MKGYVFGLAIVIAAIAGYWLRGYVTQSTCGYEPAASPSKELPGDLPSHFAGTWISHRKVDNLHMEIDGNIVSFATTGKWPDLDKVRVYLGGRPRKFFVGDDIFTLRYLEEGVALAQDYGVTTGDTILLNRDNFHSGRVVGETLFVRPSNRPAEQAAADQSTTAVKTKAE